MIRAHAHIVVVYASTTLLILRYERVNSDHYVGYVYRLPKAMFPNMDVAET